MTPASGTREERDLGTLMRVAAALTSVQDLAVLDAALAGLMLDLVPVERIVFTDGGQAPPSVRSAWTAGAGDPISHRSRVAGPRVQGAAGGRDRLRRPAGHRGADDGVRPLDRVRLGRNAAGSAARRRPRAPAAGRPGAGVGFTRAQPRGRPPAGSQRAAQGRDQSRAQHGRRAAGRCARSSIASRASPGPRRPSSCAGKAARARSSWRARCTATARAPDGRSSPSTARRSPSRCSSRSYSATRRGRSPAPSGLKKGKLELADGGTLFLDEIGELPLASAGEAAAGVAGTRVRPGWRDAARARRFPAHRGNEPRSRKQHQGRPVPSGSLLPDQRRHAGARRHCANVRTTCRCWRSISCASTRPAAAGGSAASPPSALTRLATHDWPGNVRELENVVEQALALGSDDWIVAADLPAFGDRTRPAAPESLQYHDRMEETKRDLIVRAFERAGHSHSEAARLLGVHPNYLHRLLRNLDLRARVGPGRSMGGQQSH